MSSLCCLEGIVGPTACLEVGGWLSPHGYAPRSTLAEGKPDLRGRSDLAVAEWSLGGAQWGQSSPTRAGKWSQNIHLRGGPRAEGESSGSTELGPQESRDRLELKSAHPPPLFAQ